MLHMPSNLYVEHIYKQKITKRCRKSIFCRPRRGRCLSWRRSFCCASLQAPQNSSGKRRGSKGRLHQLPETIFESGPPSLLHEGRAPNPQVMRCLILLATESALRRILSSDQRAPAAEGRVVASPEERDLHSPLVTDHSVLFFLLSRPISRFLRGNSGQRPTESIWSSSPVTMPTGRSSFHPVFPLRSLPPSLLQGTHCRWPELHHQYPPVEPVQLPRRLLYCRHGLRLKRAVSGSRCGHPRTQLVSFLLHLHTSPSLRLLPGRTRVKDTPLLFRQLSARCSRGISTRGSKTFWHLCLQLSLFVLWPTSLLATSVLLSPLAAPPSIIQAQSCDFMLVGDCLQSHLLHDCFCPNPHQPAA